MSIPTPYLVRLATPTDLPAISRIFLDSIDTTLPGRTLTDDPQYAFDKVQAVLEKRFLSEDGSVMTFVAVHPETHQVLGYVGVKKDGGSLPAGYLATSGVQPPPNMVELDHLFVKVPSEGGGGQGVGSALMKRVLEEESWSTDGIRLMCFEKNTRALRFYAKWGFEHVGKVENVEVGEREEKETALVLWRKGYIPQ